MVDTPFSPFICLFYRFSFNGQLLSFSFYPFFSVFLCSSVSFTPSIYIMDTAWGINIPFLMITSIVTGLLLTYLGVMKMVFGTFSLSHAVADYKHHRRQEDVYQQLYDKRESLLFHMDWAKSRGEKKEANKLAQEVNKVEEEMAAFLNKEKEAKEKGKFA